MRKIIAARANFSPVEWTISVADRHSDDIVRYGDDGEHMIIATNDISRVSGLIDYAQKHYQEIPRHTTEHTEHTEHTEVTDTVDFNANKTMKRVAKFRPIAAEEKEGQELQALFDGIGMKVTRENFKLACFAYQLGARRAKKGGVPQV